MHAKEIPGLVRSMGIKAGNSLVKYIKLLFVLVAWIPLGLVLWPFRRFRPVKWVPNILSAARGILVIGGSIPLFFAPMWHRDEHAVWHGLLIMAVLAATDAIDGPLASILEAQTDLGKLLDPAADKALVLVLLAGYAVLTWHEVGILVVIPLVAVDIWVFSVEYRLIRIAINTKNRVLALRSEGRSPDIKGANTFGKVKFNLQVLAIFSGWYAMIRYPSSLAGPLWMITILMLARYFADKSLGRHREELAHL